MAEAHIATLLPTQNRVVAADENTTFLAHYDLNEHDVLRNTKAIGYDKVIQFVASYMDAPSIDISIFRGPFTLEAWVNLDSVTGDQPLFSIGSAANNSQLHCVIRSGKPYLGFWSPDLASTTVLSTGTWYHLAFVYSGTQQQIYINGVLDCSATVGAFAGTVSNGTIAQYASYKLSGKMKDFRIYARAKSAAELKDSMYNVNLSEQSLRAYYKFNDNGTIIQDSSAFHNDSLVTGTYNWVADTNSVFTLRPKEGYFGGSAMAVEEGTTNLVPNFSDLSLWNRTESDVIRIDDNTVSVRRNVAGSGNWQLGRNTISWAVGDVFTISLKCKRIAGGSEGTDAFNFGLGVWSLLPTWNGTLTRSYIGDGWYYITTTLPAATNAATNQAGGLHSMANDLNATYLVKEMQIEKKSFPTSYVNGTRPSGQLVYPNSVLNRAEGTISFWLKPSVIVANTNPIFTNGHPEATGAFDLLLGSNSANGYFYYRKYTSNGAVSTQVVYSMPVPIVNRWTHIACTWKDQVSMKLYIDGALAASQPTAPFATLDGNFALGSTFRNNHNFLIDELRIDNIERTDTEIAAWYYSASPFWPRGIYRKPY
jgi:hypothetical protein